MATSRLSEEEKKEWAKKILAWSASGKSIMAWCREREMKYSKFLYWKRQIFPSNKAPCHNDEFKLPSLFLELKDSQSPSSKIVIEAQEMKVFVSAGFDDETLLKCLRVLRRI